MRKRKEKKQNKKRCALKKCNRPDKHVIGYFRDDCYWCDKTCWKESKLKSGE